MTANAPSLASLVAAVEAPRTKRDEPPEDPPDNYFELADDEVRYAESALLNHMLAHAAEIAERERLERHLLDVMNEYERYSPVFGISPMLAIERDNAVTLLARHLRSASGTEDR